MINERKIITYNYPWLSLTRTRQNNNVYIALTVNKLEMATLKTIEFCAKFSTY